MILVKEFIRLHVMQGIVVLASQLILQKTYKTLLLLYCGTW